MSKRVLVLGATGTLGKAVAHSLAERGHMVRVLARSAEKAQRMFGAMTEVFEGDSTDRDGIRKAIAGCDAVHISLPTESELIAVRHVVDLAAAQNLERISYVSATSVCEENRWFEIIEVKLRAEEALRGSGIPHTVFCPTWVMEVLHNFVKRDRAVVIVGRNPPGLHFFAAADFGRMVATAYEDERALGRRLYIHGPDAITLPNALEMFIGACYPQLKVMRLELWQARLIAKLTGQMDFVTRLIRFFDRVGELGDPAEANALLGAPSMTLSEWIESQKGRK
ncbi:MAG: SDR family NAD(P)-dependent oxidoreductase [Gemmatimonadota bacterium]|nr:MAG: SDR family NAD(P)-dependent oxidoreductase [Gemmatimonadota bacterium]